MLGGSLDADGHADFFAKPYPTLDTDFDLQKANLVPMAPMVRRFDLVLSKGAVGASGRLVLETKQTTVNLARVVLSDPAIEYVRDPRPKATPRRARRRRRDRGGDRARRARRHAGRADRERDVRA